MLITACWNHLPSSLHFLSVLISSFRFLFILCSESSSSTEKSQISHHSCPARSIKDQRKGNLVPISYHTGSEAGIRFVHCGWATQMLSDYSWTAECTFPQQQRKPSRQVAKAAQQRRKLPTVFTRRSALPVCLSLSGGWERFCGPKTSCDRGCHFERRVISE